MISANTKIRCLPVLITIISACLTPVSGNASGSAAGSASGSFSGSPIFATVVEGDYHDIADGIREAITGKGISIAHELPASEMLNRTGAAFGYKNETYKFARTFEFCSAEISHKLARQHPDNMILCPFTISLYTLKDETGKVHIVYRRPVGMPGSAPIIDEAMALIRSIIEDATW